MKIFSILTPPKHILFLIFSQNFSTKQILSLRHFYWMGLRMRYVIQDLSIISYIWVLGNLYFNSQLLVRVYGLLIQPQQTYDAEISYHIHQLLLQTYSYQVKQYPLALQGRASEEGSCFLNFLLVLQSPFLFCLLIKFLKPSIRVHFLQVFPRSRRGIISQLDAFTCV